MLTLLALMAQTVPLEADPFIAARTCAKATTVAHVGQKSQMALTSQFTFYAMHAARAQQNGKNFTTRLNDISTSMQSFPDIAATAAAALVPLCEARFPRPASTPVSLLPADPFTRDTMCLSVLSLLQGAAQETKKQGDATSLDRIELVLKPLLEKFTDAELAKRGLDTDAKFTAFFDDQLQLSVTLGEPRTVALACGVRGI